MPGWQQLQVEPSTSKIVTQPLGCIDSVGQHEESEIDCTGEAIVGSFCWSVCITQY